MNSERKTAIWVGALWIAATAFPAASAVPMGVLDDGDGIVANAASHQGQLIAWALLNMVEVISVAGVALMMYPILVRVADSSVRRGLAAWYAGTRIAESAIYAVAVTATWSFLPLSEGFVAAGRPESSHFQTTGEILQTMQDVSLAAAQTVFAVGAAMLSYLLLRSRLVPRWLASWGLIASPLFVVASLSLLWTGEPNSAVANVCFIPMAVQEMVIAVWLIVKGFDAEVLAAHPTN